MILVLLSGKKGEWIEKKIGLRTFEKTCKKERKKAMKKKLLTFLLALSVCASSIMCPVEGSMNVWAEDNVLDEDEADEDEEELEENGFKYNVLEDGTVEITGYNGNETDITIPSILDGKSVTSIGEDAFSGCASLTSIEIPSGVTSIGSGAFRGCASLTSIEIPSGVTRIGVVAFWGCASLTSITIPDGITDIWMNVFQNCSSLTSITIPDSVTYIGTGAFLNCSNLTSITIPNGAKSIGASAFSGCSKLANITIPNSVTSIGTSAFMSCNSLTDIYYNGSQSDWEKISVNSGEPNYTPMGTITRDKVGVGNNVTIHYNSTSDNTTPDTPQPPVPTISDGTTSDTPQPPTPTITALTSNNVQLSKTSVTYNGKAQKPSVIVKDANGNTVNASNYTVSYSNNKNVGQASVTVTFSGNYSGTVKKTFNIVPKGTSLSKVTAQKKGFTAKWKKQAVQTTGYEIQYSTSSKFKGAKTVKNIKAKTTSKRISKLKAKKKYYVRIRTYKTVKGKKYYSSWSKSKKVVTKK